MLIGAADLGSDIESNPNAAAQAGENIERSSRGEESKTIPSSRASDGITTDSAQLHAASREIITEPEQEDVHASNKSGNPGGNASASAVEIPADTNVISAVAGDAKRPRSPRAKAVTFDSVDRIVVIETEDADEDESDALAYSPRPMHETSLHGGPEDSTEKAKASTEAAAKADAKNSEEIYQQAYVALEHVLTDVSKDALDTIGEAYLAASIHESLINAIRLVSWMFCVFTRGLLNPCTAPSDKPNSVTPQLACLWMLYRMSMSTDEVRSEMIRGELLQKLRSIMESEGSTEARQYSCNIVQGLLSDEGDDEEVMDAVVAADFVPPLAKYMK